ncbi:hypothetical protein WJU23_18100 [Prosthecobacter sp. SYSU 5D2]|uniref:ABC transporter permease n=1 Tax=Prosthecobacter sp. SYSU 5D2 TaxID=3134134 RepID=UPI0031FEC856
MATLNLLADFPDQLSPMVVKELRQGLRTRLFGGVMLVLHALMVIITLMGGATSNASGVRGLMDGLVTLMLCVIFPLCGFSALAGEIKSNTMDMLVLTRLSAGRIVLGKWAAIVVQSLLVTVSLVPYIVARYVYGGSDLLADLGGLASQWLLSAVLTAGVVALSTQKQFWVRALFLVLPLLLVFFFSFTRFFIGSFSVMMAERHSWLPYVSMIATLSWLIFALLSFGASRIAPASSMLPLTKRTVNLGAMFLLAALEWTTSGGAAVSSACSLLVVVASLDAMTDDLRNLPSVYLPFYRRGWWGRLGSWFFAPGWMHGFCYSLLFSAVAMFLAGWAEGTEAAANIWLLSCCVWAAVLFGQILAITRTGEYLSATFAGLCILAFFSMMASLIIGATDKYDLKWVHYLLPPNTLWLVSAAPGIKSMLFERHVGVLLSAIWPLFLFSLALLAFWRTRSSRREARKLLLS